MRKQIHLEKSSIREEKSQMQAQKNKTQAPNCVSAIFHSSLFTLLFSLKNLELLSLMIWIKHQKTAYHSRPEVFPHQDTHSRKHS